MKNEVSKTTQRSINWLVLNGGYIMGFAIFFGIIIGSLIIGYSIQTGLFKIAEVYYKKKN